MKMVFSDPCRVGRWEQYTPFRRAACASCHFNEHTWSHQSKAKNIRNLCFFTIPIPDGKAPQCVDSSDSESLTLYEEEASLRNSRKAALSKSVVVFTEQRASVWWNLVNSDVRSDSLSPCSYRHSRTISRSSSRLVSINSLTSPGLSQTLKWQIFISE